MDGANIFSYNENRPEIILPIKKVWFDMILAGIKKEEYREIKPYYIKRLANLTHMKEARFLDFMKDGMFIDMRVIFRNGYSSTSPSFAHSCLVFIGEGNPDWGADSGEKYFVFEMIGEPLETKNIN